jgi:amino acid transporter
VLIAAALWHGHHLAVNTAWHSHPAGVGGVSTAILVALWNYMGWDNASTVAREVEDPQRNYPRAMFLSVATVAITYVLPLAAVAYAGLSITRFTTGSWADAATAVAGPWLAAAIVLGGTLTGLGMFNALMMSYARLPMVLAQDGLLPPLLARTNRRGVPWAAVLACGLCWALALRFSFERLISIDLILYGASLILEFIALIVLRVREPHLPRPFRAGNFATAIGISVPPTALILFAMYAARDERLAHMPALLFGLLVACGGPVFFWISRRVWGRRSTAETLPGVSQE